MVNPILIARHQEVFSVAPPLHHRAVVFSVPLPLELKHRQQAAASLVLLRLEKVVLLPHLPSLHSAHQPPLKVQTLGVSLELNLPRLAPLAHLLAGLFLVPQPAPPGVFLEPSRHKPPATPQQLP